MPAAEDNVVEAARALAAAAPGPAHRINPALVALLLALAVASPLSHAAAKPAPAPAANTKVPAGAYTLDKAHSSLIFRVNHLGFSHFTLRFTRLDAQLQFDPDNLAAAKVTVTIDPSSIETHYPEPAKIDFDAHLRGEEWLNTAKFAEINFHSTKVEPTGRNTMRINGELELHGVTRPDTLEAKYNGGYAGHPLDPQARIGFSAHAAIKRSDFGIAYGLPAPGTTMGVFDPVEVVIEAEFNGPHWSGADQK